MRPIGIYQFYKKKYDDEIMLMMNKIKEYIQNEKFN